MLELPSLSFLSSPNYSSRGGQKVRLCVIHDCEGSFGGSISWFAQPASRVSAHIVLSDDGTRAVQMVAWANKAWAVCDFNPETESYEAAGYSAKGLGAPEWQALANITAFRLKALGLPPTHAKGGVSVGFCQHVDLGVLGGGHHDVTSDPSVWSAFINMVQIAYLQPMPQSWKPRDAVGAIPEAASGWKPSATARHDLPYGSIEWVQMHLNALGYAKPTLIVDGLMGPATEKAVAAFQRAKWLYIDGEPGPNTIAALAA